MTNKTKDIRLHTMKLHEVLHHQDPLVQIMCVPGGWIYTTYSEEYNPRIDGRDVTNYRISSVFVPYNEEFKTIPE